MRTVTLYEHRCRRCDGTFMSRQLKPVRCGKAVCRSPYWQTRRTRK